jgi:Tfp pilus assembly protein PilO
MITKAIDTIKRNSRIAVLIGIIIILAVVTFMMYSGWSSAADQQSELEKEELRARTNLNIALEQYNLDKLRSEYQTLSVGPGFPSSFPSVDLSAFIAAAAEKWGVTLESLTPKGTTGTETIGGKKYNRYEAAAKVTGSYDRMNSMLRYLEEAGAFSTLRIESLSLTQTDGSFNIVFLTQ